MKNIILFVAIYFLIAGFFSCNKKSKENVETIVTTERWTWPDSVENMLINIPDSIRERMSKDSTYTMKEYLPPKQWEIYKAVYKIIYDHERVENDRIVFTMSREEFLKTGIPEAYYDWILAGIKDYDDYMVRYGENIFGDSLDIMWERARIEMRKEFPDIDK